LLSIKVFAVFAEAPDDTSKLFMLERQNWIGQHVALLMM
jgi:hypothetical protein